MCYAPANHFLPVSFEYMSRPVRIEFPGATYHVTSRGVVGRTVFSSDDDRKLFFNALAMVVERFGWLLHSYVLMDDHYHLVIETPHANLSRGMRQLNGVYTQCVNRAHKEVGPVFKGRFKSILVEKETYLLEVCRYVVLNPVRCNLVTLADKYRWSSCRAIAGDIRTPDWLHTDWMLSNFGQLKATSQDKYRQYVRQGLGDTSPLSSKCQQVLLGQPDFLKKMQPLLGNQLLAKKAPVRAGRRRSLAGIFVTVDGKPRSYRNELICKAHFDYAYTLVQIGDYLGLHYTTVSKIVNSSGHGLALK